MRLLFLLLAILPVLAFTGTPFAQTVVSGTISSFNSDPVPNVWITIHQSGESDLFSGMDDIQAAEDGSYRIDFPAPGIYTISIYSVFHRWVNIPIMIYDQDRIKMDIYLTPKKYIGDRYFHKSEYTDWIRAYGNFNEYDFFSGEKFSYNSDGSISAYIKTDRDTIRYQIRGLTSGPSVLPGADYYAIRDDRTFEAVVINSNDSDSLELRYDPAEEFPFPSFIPDSLNQIQAQLRTIISFDNELDYQWIQPLTLMHNTQGRVFMAEGYKFETLTVDLIQKAYLNSKSGYSVSNVDEAIKDVVDMLSRSDLHPQQRSALYISYMSLLIQQEQWYGFIERWRPEEEWHKPAINSELVLEITEQVHPLHPLWGRNSHAALKLLQISSYHPDVVKYAAEMIRGHESEMVVRNLVLDLVEQKAKSYDSYKEMPYYKWIVDRYGENNLARRAVLTFRKSKEDLPE